MSMKLTVEEIDAIREESIKEWAAANGALQELHRYLARAVERYCTQGKAELIEANVTLEAALSGRHDELARLNLRIGQLEEALRQVGMGSANTPAQQIKERRRFEERG